MKILYLATGGSIHDYRFLVKLVERDYDTCYAYLEPAGEKFAVPGVVPRYIGVMPRQEQKEGGAPAPPDPRHGAIKEKIKKAILPFSEAILFRRYLRNLNKLLREFKPDILHAGWALDAGFIAAMTGFRPLLLMPWGSDILIYPDLSRFYRARVRYAIHRSDMITCDAEEMKRRIIELTGYPAEKIILFPWGIDLGLFKPDAIQRELTRKKLGWENNQIMVMTRNYRPVYSVEDFIRALPEVFSIHQQARALFIGSGPLENELKALASDLGLMEKVKFLGAVENEELPAYLNAADIYVSSSLSDGASLSLLESLACALPVVVTDVPSNLEWIKDGVNGRVAPRRDPVGLARALIDLLEDKDLMLKAARANLNLAKSRADWDLNFTELENIYRTLDNSKRKS